ncbi:MAG: hypothetical protein DI616_07360 [Paracoccus denitrificans]|uniref:Uncharacterized protein n=1 Tax=Paracoccus denitrificans TaxID=266 RepID=A0A533ICD3_PARDE|nr:MAG: hypothetical protein DI616_07360 [Paracoccus denitrificans]
MQFRYRISVILLGVSLALPAFADQALVDAFTKTNRSTKWEMASKTKVNFPTFHPQGMTRIGDEIFVSSVEIIEPTEKFDTPQGGMDRTAGKGKGHLFKMSPDGELLDQVVLGEGDIYHPGGIDYDGEFIWVPVAEYRPNSNSIVYKVNPKTMKAEEVFRYPDHIGGILHDVSTSKLHAVSWGSRRFYAFDLAKDGSVSNADTPREDLMVANPAAYIDYQDCQLAIPGMALCNGVAEYTMGEQKFRLGGVDLVDLAQNRAVHATPIPVWTESGLDMPHNPAYMEATETGLRGYFMPEDDESTLYVLEAKLED